MAKIQLTRGDIAIGLCILILISILGGVLLAHWNLQGDLHDCKKKLQQHCDCRIVRGPGMDDVANKLAKINITEGLPWFKNTT